MPFAAHNETLGVSWFARLLLMMPRIETHAVDIYQLLSLPVH
jgi:hypothetical protein